MNIHDELGFVRTDVAELKARIERVEQFILRMLDRIVELERERAAGTTTDRAAADETD